MGDQLNIGYEFIKYASLMSSNKSETDLRLWKVWQLHILDILLALKSGSLSLILYYLGNKNPTNFAETNSRLNKLINYPR